MPLAERADATRGDINVTGKLKQAGQLTVSFFFPLEIDEWHLGEVFATSITFLLLRKLCQS
jgi:hypothetical protein